MHTADRSEYAALSDRMTALLILRFAMAGIVAVWALLRPEVLGIGLVPLLAVSAGYVVVAATDEWARRTSRRRGLPLITLMLLIDGLFLAWAMYVTGGTQSPLRFLVYLHLVAVSLLASYRTGLKLALWDSLLLMVVLYAQAAQLVPSVDVVAGAAIEFERMPLLNVMSFWLFALATSVFSAMNERELRHRRADLQTIVDIGARLDDMSDPIRQSMTVLDGLAERFDFQRGVVIGASDDQMIILAAIGTDGVPTMAFRPDAIVARAWERREILAVRQLEPGLDPVLAEVLPGARNLLVAPMIADGRSVGAIVVEHPSSTIRGVDRRVSCGPRPGLRHRRAQPAQCRAAARRAGPRRTRLPDRRRQSPDVPDEPGASAGRRDHALEEGHGRPVHRPRRLQGGQRHARPRGR